MDKESGASTGRYHESKHDRDCCVFAPQSCQPVTFDPFVPASASLTVTYGVNERSRTLNKPLVPVLSLCWGQRA